MSTRTDTVGEIYSLVSFILILHQLYKTTPKEEQTSSGAME